jgi:hypothetical protein
MSDSDIGDEVPTTELSAVACFPHGPAYVLALMDKQGDLTAYRLSEQKLRQVAVVIARAVEGQPVGSLPGF